MNRKLVTTGVVVLVVIAAVTFAVFGMNKDATAPSGSSSEDTQTTQNTDSESSDTQPESEATETATITFTNDGFSPNSLTVKKGATVTVKNSSSVDVQFSSDDHPTHRLDPEINLEVLEPGQSASFVAKTVGTHGFHDHIDDSKVGTLIVTE